MLSVLFIGCGAVFDCLYKRPLQQLESAHLIRVSGVVDPSEPRRVGAARVFTDCTPFPALDDALFSLRKVDLTVIASPPIWHAAQAVRAMESGSHILCEKPMAHSISAGEEMAAAAKNAGVTFAVGMVRRYYPAIAAAKPLLAEIAPRGGLRFTYREGVTFDWPIASAAQFSRNSGGGGVLLDRGIHALDTLCFLLNGPARMVASADDATGANTVEANVHLELALGQSNGTLQLSWENRLNNGLLLSGPDGDLWLPIHPITDLWRRHGTGVRVWQHIRANNSWPEGVRERREKTTMPRNEQDCIRLQIVSVLRSIILGEPPTVGPEEGLKALRLMTAAYAQAKPLLKPWLSDAENEELASSHWRRVAENKGPSLA